MLTVNKNLVSLDEVDRRTLVCEASTIGVKPCEWPDLISVVDDAGEGLLFQRGRVEENADRSVLAYNYVTRDGAFRMLVFND